MGKLAPDEMIDASLDYVAGSDMFVVCSGSPSDYSETIANLLAAATVTSGCFIKADDTSGRKITMSAKTGIDITAGGFAEAVALIEASGSTLRYVTTCTGQQLVSGGTVDLPAWKINIEDPT